MNDQGTTRQGTSSGQDTSAMHSKEWSETALWPCPKNGPHFMLKFQAEHLNKILSESEKEKYRKRK